MSIIGHLLRLLAIVVTGLFARQSAKSADETAKSGQDDEGGIRG
jgi:hypothetical protein